VHHGFNNDPNFLQKEHYFTEKDEWGSKSNEVLTKRKTFYERKAKAFFVE